MSGVVDHRAVVPRVAESEACRHPKGTIGPGPLIPRVYGSGQTDICGGCGAWRTAFGGAPGPWRPEATLLDAMEEHDGG